MIAGLLETVASPLGRQKLRPGGRMYLEIGAGQGDAARSLAESLLPHAEVRVVRDYVDLDRLLIVALPETRTLTTLTPGRNQPSAPERR